MAYSFVYAPPSAQADASRTNEFADALRAGSPRKEAHQAGAKSKSSFQRTNQSGSSLFAKRLEEKRT